MPADLTPSNVWIWLTLGGILLLTLLWLVWQITRLTTRITDIQTRFQLIQGNDERLERGLREELSVNRREVAESLSQTREELNRIIERLSASLSAQSDQLRKLVDDKLNQVQQDARAGRTEQNESLKGFGELVTSQLHQLMQRNAEGVDTLRQSIEKRLGDIQTDNNQKLEQMRQTVDEKLHNTLEQRLGESFKRVSEQLERVHTGLGEMQSLASGVGDLKKVLSNVKVRGTWGEVQLDNLLEQILSPGQYDKNIATRPNSTERVEFAIKLPGRDDAGTSVWLPIDAKFPLEDYQKLLEAQDQGDLARMEEASKALEIRIRTEAKTIRDKYIEPPHTTDFGLLFLPIEGLYAEIIRRPGLHDALQRDYRVTITGPTTLTAILNSLQMGFRTLAIEKRSSEVWQVLSAVKTEFGKFGDVLAKTKKKLDEASRTIEQAEVCTRAIDRKLKTVESLPTTEAAVMLQDVTGKPDDQEYTSQYDA